MTSQAAVVALTDDRWFTYLASRATDGRLDEVNFWRPMGTAFRALEPGEPFFFRLKHPSNVICGYGYFAHFTVLPIQMAWKTFEQRNGDANFASFLNRIAVYRHESPAETASGNQPLGCIVLREVRFLAREDWLPWGRTRDWSANIVAYKGYDLVADNGLILRYLLRNDAPADLVDDFVLVDEDSRIRAEELIALREGQGAFRLRVLDAYDRRCAITGERSLPVLDAAHIQPYRGAASNHVQNGLSLRADIHRLYDEGYVTVTPDLRFEVSSRLREEFDNGHEYYELNGRRLIVLPSGRDEQPSRQALEWHANNIYKG